MIEIISPKNGYEHSLNTELQKEFLSRNLRGEHTTEEGYEWLTEIKTDDDLTCPAFLEIQWVSDKESHIELSLYPDMRDFTDYPGNPVPAELEHLGEIDGVYTALVKNMFAGVIYYFKAVSDDGTEESEVRTFTTLGEYPRLIAVDGITNVRDLGLLPTFDGKRIKQGCIYRGVALESIISDDGYSLTPHGKMQMEYLLGIKNELEIRMDAEGKFTEMVENRCKLIEFFADENNYPIYFHCAIGADRTGTLAMILGILLGIKRYYVDLDFNLTSLTQNNIRSQITEERFYADCEDDKSGECLEAVVMKKCERFLIEESGVSPETIARLRRNLLE